MSHTKASPQHIIVYSLMTNVDFVIFDLTEVVDIVSLLLRRTIKVNRTAGALGNHVESKEASRRPICDSTEQDTGST